MTTNEGALGNSGKETLNFNGKKTSGRTMLLEGQPSTVTSCGSRERWQKRQTMGDKLNLIIANMQLWCMDTWRVKRNE